MKKYYISSLNGISGITKYSKDFFELVLKDKGYEFVDSDQSLSTILSMISSRDHVHIELGVFQKKELEILLAMLRGQYKNISATLHDAPLLKYPFSEFSNPLLNSFSKLLDQFGKSEKATAQLLEQLKAVYVLTKIGHDILRDKYKLSNAFYLPHIVNPGELNFSNKEKNNLVYFGFIGPNKGLDYCLQLHRELIERYPDLLLFVIGKPIGKQKEYYEKLKSKYSRNVQYLGYLPEKSVDEVYKQSSIAILPFRSYRFFYPFSGSILYSLKKGAVVFTKRNNAIPELIEEGVNGYFLSGNSTSDSRKLMQVIENHELLGKIRQQSQQYLANRHYPEVVRKFFKD
jgi:glycosyltransferase involved in cell wall biosynthesis